jgi:dihydrofolate reductase
MWNIVTLDVLFEGPRRWDLSWQQCWGEDMDRFSLEQLRTADLLIFGRVTYQGMAAYWPSAKESVAEYMNRLPKFVFSRSMSTPTWGNTTLVADDPKAALPRLRRSGNGNMFVFGSACLCETFVKNDDFDELRIGIAPIIRGSGRTVFSGLMRLQTLRLQEVRRMPSGFLVLRYAQGR